MATSTRQTNLFVSEDWRKVYQTFKSADFQSYDFETLRTTMISYLRKQFPEDFNDFVESSEYIALIDLIAFFGQSLAYRQDLNARENFLETAQRRDSILRLANLLSYQPKRNTTAVGLLKVISISTTEQVYDSNNNNLSGKTVFWDDSVNSDYEEQYNTIINAALSSEQRIGKPALEKSTGSIKTQEYELNLLAGTQPYLPFTAPVNGADTKFELVNGTISGQDYVYEKSPIPGSTYNFLYRSDGKGNSSANTGFFTMFKQGSLGQTDFQLTSGLPNITFSIDKSNINNTDVWLYELNDNGRLGSRWTQVPSVTGSNVIYNSLSLSNRKLFAVESQVNDKIKLVFADGVFANIPKGRFRCYHRQSAGTTYSIKSTDVQNIGLSFNYISRTNQQETLSISLSLQQNINTASRNEKLSKIKQLAPQSYYTQNRMINGEDYNIFPLTKFTSIIKSKAVNRAASGISRFLDVKDTTGKFSSTNIFGDDGVLYEEYTTKKDTFSFTNDNEIISVIKNILEKNLANEGMYHFYLNKFVPQVFTNTVTWVKVSSTANTTTGYFKDTNGDVVQIGSSVSNLNQYLTLNSMIKFIPEAGKHFMANGTHMAGTDTDHLGATKQTWSSIKLVDENGLGTLGNGLKSAGVGAVTLNELVPTGATVEKVFPKWISDLPTNLETTIKTNIKEYKDFGIRFDHATSTWSIITSENLSVDKDYNDSNAGNTLGTKNDASWLVQFTTDGVQYTMKSRQLDFYFSSKDETRFYFDKNVKIYDSVTGSTIKDRCTVLKVNNLPTDNKPLEEDYALDIIDMVTESDGYKDNTKVKITFGDADNDSVTDNPEMFKNIVGTDDITGAATDRKLVFFKQFYDYDNIERYQALDNSVVCHDYKTMKEANNNMALFPVGKVFYATTDNKFAISFLDDTNTLKMSLSGEPGAQFSTNPSNTDPQAYKVYIGRNNLKFQYKHNTPNNRRIDPSPSNLIDMYILTQAYADSYREWINDSTNIVTKPSQPTAEVLRTSFSSIENSKSISDTIIYHSAKFKPLFGAKADTTLQASFKVVKNTNIGISDSEIKASLIEAINVYFNILNWDFGDTFYFSELSAYLHNSLATKISSVVIVPKSTTQVFGSLFQIRSNHDEILISGATVDDVEIIDSITATKIQAGGSIASLETTTNTTASAVTTSGGTY